MEGMNEKDKKEIITAVKDAVQEHVNGKIDKIDKKIDAHLTEIDPFLDGWKGAKAFATFLKWAFGFIVALAATVAVFTNKL